MQQGHYVTADGDSLALWKLNLNGTDSLIYKIQCNYTFQDNTTNELILKLSDSNEFYAIGRFRVLNKTIKNQPITPDYNFSYPLPVLIHLDAYGDIKHKETILENKTLIYSSAWGNNGFRYGFDQNNSEILRGVSFLVNGNIVFNTYVDAVGRGNFPNKIAFNYDTTYIDYSYIGGAIHHSIYSNQSISTNIDLYTNDYYYPNRAGLYLDDGINKLYQYNSNGTNSNYPISKIREFSIGNGLIKRVSDFNSRQSTYYSILLKNNSLVNFETLQITSPFIIGRFYENKTFLIASPNFICGYPEEEFGYTLLGARLRTNNCLNGTFNGHIAQLILSENGQIKNVSRSPGVIYSILKEQDYTQNFAPQAFSLQNNSTINGLNLSHNWLITAINSNGNIQSFFTTDNNSIIDGVSDTSGQITAVIQATGPIQINGRTYNVSNNVIVLGPAPAACTTIYDTLNVQTCDNYTSPSGTQIWNVAGTYNDTLQSSTGCDSIVTVHLTIQPLQINLQDTLLSCGLDSIQLDAGSGLSTYNWSTGANTQTTYVSNSGLYYITATNGTGCSAVDSIYVSLINSQIAQDDTTICSEDTLSLSITSGSSSSISTILPTNLQNGLVAWYPFNGNANDESGNTFNPIILNANLTTNRFGLANSAYQFDGNNYITYPYNGISGNISRSISLWFYSIDSNSTQNVLINFGDQSASGSTFEVGLNWGACNNGIYIDSRDDAFERSDKNLANGEWHNMVVIFENTGSSLYSTNIYVDGVSLPICWTYGGNLNINTVSSPIYIGKLFNNTRWFNGKIDDIGIWNRALTPQEIQQLYTNQTYVWSTGDTTASINVSPAHTTTYYVTITDGVGSCVDSVTVTVNQPDTNGVTEVACGSYTWPANGQTYATSGAYNTTLTNAAGCDSVVTLNLSINQSSSGSETVTAVQTYTWPTNNQTYTSSGTYNATIPNAVGCDSVITLNLTIVPPLTVNTTSNDTIICAGESASISVNATPEINNSTSSFNMKVRTTNPGVSGSNQFQLTGAEGEYNVEAVHLATGTIETFNNLVNEQILTFSSGPGDYLVKVDPIGNTPFHRIQFNNTGDRSKLIEVRQWGTVVWSTWENIFWGCDSMNITTLDLPNLGNVVNSSNAFRDCGLLNGPANLGSWDVSSVTTVNNMFSSATSFNQDISNWDVSAATNMQYLFYQASAFNSNISNWDVSSVTTMQGMFQGASSFNQDIGSWDVSSVTNTSYMFRDAINFNQYIGDWDVSLVTTIRDMFMNTSFNQDISNWDVSNVSNMVGVFHGASSFNQDIGSWNISSVANIWYMFNGASAFNQDISNWDVSSVINMSGMFNGATSFNQDLSDWCVTNITSQPSDFSTNSALTSANHPVWGTCPSQTPQYPAGTVHCNGTPTAVVEVTNPITGKTWMDRNLGASQAATSSTDAAAYGDLYQWGRGADGHQCRNSTTTTTLSSTDQPGHGDFIITSSPPYDWRSPQNTNLWQGVNGVNNPCPNSYRLPTVTELNAELLSWNQNNFAGAFSSPLKLTMAGLRYDTDGLIYDINLNGFYWSSTINSLSSQTLNFFTIGANISANVLAYGLSIRCIKD